MTATVLLESTASCFLVKLIGDSVFLQRGGLEFAVSRSLGVI